METFINNPGTMARLDALHAANENEMVEEARRQFAGDDTEFFCLLEKYRQSPADEQGALLSTYDIDLQKDHLSLGVSDATGRLLYLMARAIRAERILELGSSTGLSTAWLAGALKDMNRGQVIATEIVPEKIDKLQKLMRSLGLSDFVHIVAGDVFVTARELDKTFDLIFLDVWAKDYLDILRSVERLCRPGTVVVADNLLTAGNELDAFISYTQASPFWCSLTLPMESGLRLMVAV